MENKIIEAIEKEYRFIPKIVSSEVAERLLHSLQFIITNNKDKDCNKVRLAQALRLLIHKSILMDIDLNKAIKISEEILKNIS